MQNIGGKGWNMAAINWIYAYYQGIKDGTFTVSRWVRMVYEYVVKGLESRTFFFDQKRANDAIDWIETHCSHTEGPDAPGPIRLELWQKAFLSCVYGLVDESGKRQFREIFLVIGRKNGKTKIAASIAAYTYRLEGGFGARVFCIAPKLEQADLVYNDVWMMTQLDPEYKRLKELYSERDVHNKYIITTNFQFLKQSYYEIYQQYPQVICSCHCFYGFNSSNNISSGKPIF